MGDGDLDLPLLRACAVCALHCSGEIVRKSGPLQVTARYAITITKQASGTAKIDPRMAAFNAVAWMSANPATSQPIIFVISHAVLATRDATGLGSFMTG